VTLLRLWLLATAAILTALAIWAFAPVLLFAAAVALGLGAVSAGMIALARRIEARWQRRRPSDNAE